MYRKPAYLILFLSFAASGCYYDNEEELYPYDFCDVTNVTYSSTIAPIVQGNCALPGCHVPGGTSPDLTTYAGLKSVADNGKLEQQVLVNRTMPPSGALPACDQLALKAWLDAGAPNF